MSAPALVTLAAWGQARYGEHVPTIFTLRRWVKDGYIFPAPEKHGRTFYVRADAQYMKPNDSRRVEVIESPANSSNRLIRSMYVSKAT
jgi:hypothetical protein